MVVSHPIPEGFGPSYSAAVADYLLTLRAAGCSEKTTVANRRRILERFGQHVDGRLAPAPSTAAMFLADLCVSRNTRAQYMTALRLFFTYCVAQGWTPSNPLAAIPQIKYRPMPVYPLTLDEVRRALAVATPRQADIIMILVSTGIRAGELAGIREGDIDWERQVVRIRGKGDWERVVALGERAKGALRRQVGHLTYDIIRAEFRQVQRSTRNWGLHAHRLRHTFSVEFLRGGGRLDLLQKLLGHRNLSTTMVYIAYDSQEEALEAQRALNPANRLDSNFDSNPGAG